MIPEYKKLFWYNFLILEYKKLFWYNFLIPEYKKLFSKDPFLIPVHKKAIKYQNTRKLL